MEFDTRNMIHTFTNVYIIRIMLNVIEKRMEKKWKKIA